MKLETLTIAPEFAYKAPGADNPYVATLRVSYNETTMQVKLSPEVCHRILELAGADIASAAQVQINDFVQGALAVSAPPEPAPTLSNLDDENPF